MIPLSISTVSFLVMTILGALSSIVATLITTYINKRKSNIKQDIVIHTGKGDKVISIKLDSSDKEIESQIKSILEIINPKVFISYSREDKEIAMKIAKQLEDRRINVWHDGQIKIGENWQKSIQDAIDESNYFLVLLSQNYANSKFVEIELKKFRERGKMILPIIIDKNLSRIPPQLAKIQAANYSENPEESIESVINIVKEIE